MLLSTTDPPSLSQAQRLQAKVQLAIKSTHSRRSVALGTVDFLFSKVDG